MELELRINGVIASLDIAPNETLLSLLRREGYRSVKQGCGTGECGSCTVLVDGVPRPSCVMLAGQAGGCSLTTVEQLGDIDTLHPLQQAFVEVGAVQCGFCTPGMLLSAYALLQRNANPTEEDVRDALSGNLCRCTGYARPIQAVLRAAALLRGEVVTPVTYNVLSQEDIEAEKSSPVTASVGASPSEKTLALPAPADSGATTKIPVLASASLSAAHMDATKSVLGKPLPERNAAKLVSGKPVFAGDIYPHNMLYGRILTCPHAHAVISEIDVTEARALPGVHAVLTYRDVPRVPYSSVERSSLENKLEDQYCLDYIMRHVGDRVAAVAAETPEIAEEALSLIKVEYTIQPAVLHPRQALEPKAPCLHPESESRGIYNASRNIAARVHSECGNVEQGFSQADVIVENEYLIPLVQDAPPETHTVITYFDDEQRLIVRASTQAPHHVRRTLAHILDLPLSRIRVIRPEVGGGFGVKQEIVLEDLCALLTMVTKRPVMLSASREESFKFGRVRPQCFIRLKTGVKKDGTIVANQAIVLTGTGAYGTHPLIERHNVIANALSLYPCPHMQYIAEVVYTNLPPSGAYHGYGMPQEVFALESHMDDIARKLGIDALALRRKNWIRAGDTYPLARELVSGNASVPSVTSCGLEECLRLVEEKLDWRAKRGKADKGRLRRGVGIALSLHEHSSLSKRAGADVSGAIIKLNEDGTFDVFAGANNAGYGTATLLSQLIAEILGVPPDTIHIHASDTDVVPYEAGANGSATLYASGGVVLKAAEQIRRQIFSVAGRMLHALPESLKISEGKITATTNKVVTIQQIAAYMLHVEGLHIMTTASWREQQTPTAFAAQGVEVEVDCETGAVRVLKAVTAVDAGRVINPLIAVGQVEGSTVQGLGMGVCEELVYDQTGKILPANFRDYHVYNALDVPDIQTYLIETKDFTSLFGAKAVAEIPLLGIAPAIANAVADALGIRIRQMPLSPERILRAIHAQSQPTR